MGVRVLRTSPVVVGEGMGIVPDTAGRLSEQILSVMIMNRPEVSDLRVLLYYIFSVLFPYHIVTFPFFALKRKRPLGPIASRRKGSMNFLCVGETGDLSVRTHVFPRLS